MLELTPCRRFVTFYNGLWTYFDVFDLNCVKRGIGYDRRIRLCQLSSFESDFNKTIRICIAPFVLITYAGFGIFF